MRRVEVVQCVASVLLAALSSNVEVGAQQPPRRAPEWAMERETRERWIHGAQSPQFTAFREDRTFLAIDSIRRAGNLRRVDITLRPTGTGRDSAVITSDATGRIVRVDAGLAPMREFRNAQDSLFSERFNRVTLDGRMMLPAARVWDLIVTFPQNPRTGARWTDTIAQSATDGQYAQTISGNRTSRIVGDTSIDGQRLWIVRDSAPVTLEERRPEPESTLGADAQVSRVVSGIVRGVYLYDPVSQLTHRRIDTTRLSGEAVLRYPDGRVFRTPARYQRFRTWQLHDSTRYKARRDALNRESADRMGGMVIIAEPGVPQRLQQGDVALQDSLVGVMRRAVDGAEALRLYQTLTTWSRSNANLRRSLDSILIALGDSGHLYRTLQDVAYTRSPFNTDDVRAMIPFLEDPGKAWALNANRDYLYSNLVQGMTIWPLAAPGYRGRTACSPDACRLLGSYYHTAREPRLRDVALVALFTTDPATWGDTVLRLGGATHPLLRGSVALADGVGANWPAARKLPMPSVSGDWRAWLLWMDGRDPEHARQQLANATRYGWPVDTAPRPRFEETHRVALRMHIAQTGRDIIGELRRGFDGATNDTAHLVFGTLLHGLDALRLTDAQMVDAFSSGVPGRAALARRALTAFGTDFTPMPDSLAAPLVDRLLGIVLDTVAPWRNIQADVRARIRASPELHARRGRARLSGLNLPASIREKWAGRVEIITPGQVRGGDLREHAVSYTLKPVVQFGRFVRLTIDASEQMARRADQAPALYASSTTYYLMQLGDEWVIVAMESWVT